MKTKLIVGLFLITCFGFVKIQDIIKVNATFDEYDEGNFSFSDEEEGGYLFQRIDSVASNKYDLTDEKYLGKRFTVSYRVETEMDENDETYEIFAIMDLKLLE